MSQPGKSANEGWKAASGLHSGQGEASGREDILALIDGAIGDCAVSGDAMRWTPEPTKAEANVRRVSIGGVDVTPQVSRIEAGQVDVDWFVVDEVHTFADHAMLAALPPIERHGLFHLTTARDAGPSATEPLTVASLRRVAELMLNNERYDR